MLPDGPELAVLHDGVGALSLNPTLSVNLNRLSHAQSVKVLERVAFAAVLAVPTASLYAWADHHLTEAEGGRTFAVESRGGNGRWFRKEPPEEAFSGFHLFRLVSGGPVGAKQLPAVDAGRMSVVPGDADPPRADELRVDDPQRLRRGGQRPDGQVAIAPRAALHGQCWRSSSRPNPLVVPSAQVSVTPRSRSTSIVTGAGVAGIGLQSPSRPHGLWVPETRSAPRSSRSGSATSDGVGKQTRRS